MLFHQKTRNTVKNITWSEMNHPSLSKQSTGCTRQDLGRSIASCCLLPTCSVLAKSVTVSVSVSKVGVVLHQAWSKSQCTVLMGYLTISTNVRRYQTHHRWLFFSFRKIAHRCIVCNTIQLSEICDFRVSPFCQVVQKHKLLGVA